MFKGQSNTRKIAFVLIVVCFSISTLFAQGFSRIPTPADTVLVSIGDTAITTTDLRNVIDTMPAMRRATSKSVDGQIQLLENLISQELLYKRAVELGYHELENVQTAINNALRQPIIQLYFMEIAERESQISDDEIRAYYQENIDRFTIPSRTTIIHLMVNPDEVQTVLAGEIPFEELARTINKNEYARGNNGIIPNIRGTGLIQGAGNDPELDRHIAEAAVSAEVVYGPFETSTGIHFFKKISYTPPQIRELEELEEDIADVLINEKVNRFYIAMTDRLRAKYRVVIHSNMLSEYNLQSLSPQHRELVIVESTNPDIRMTLADASIVIRRNAQDTANINNIETQSRILSTELDSRLIYAEAVDTRFLERNRQNFQIANIIHNQVIAAFLNSQIRSQIGISDEEIAEYYNENQSRFTTPPSRNIRQFIAKDQRSANKHRNTIIKHLRRKDPIDRDNRIITLIRKESLLPENDGLIENIYQNNIIPGYGVDEDYSRRVWELQIGQVSTPFVDKKENIVFFYIVSETPPELRPLAAVQGSIRQTLQRSKETEVYQQMLNQLAEEYGVVRHFDRIVSFISPEELFTIAVEAQRSFAYNEAISIYDQIIKDFAGTQDAARAMFMKAFVTAEDLKNTDKAIEIFEEMIRLFPDGDLNESAEFMIETLRSDTPIEEILQAE